MEKGSLLKRLLSLFLVAAMCLSFLPNVSFAAGESGATWKKVESEEGLTSGKYVLVVDAGYALGALDGTWVTSVEHAEEPTADSPVWDLTVANGAVIITDANGKSIAPSGGNNNGIKESAYEWAYSFADGKFQFLGQGSDTVTLASNKGSAYKFRAYKNDTVTKTPASYPSNFTLYKMEEAAPADPFTEITSEEALVTGKYVLVVDAGYALGALDGTWVTSVEHAEEPTADSPVWDLTVANGAVTITDANGKSIAPSGGNNNGIKEGAYKWAYSFADGKFQFLGQGSDTVTLASNKGSAYKFRAYKNDTVTKTPASYPSNFTLYKVNGTGTTDPGTDPEPQPSELYKPANGDKVVIYNASNGKVMTDEAGAKGLNGGDATVSNGKLTAEAALVLTVKVEGDIYTFTTADGKYLTSAATGNGATLESAASDYSTWQLREQDDGWYIVSVNAKYQDKEQALEYYSNQFYAFTLNNGGNAYLMTFYKDYEITGEVGGEDPTPDGIKDGTYVIWAPAYNMALSSNYNGFYNKGVAVAETNGALTGYEASEVWTVTKQSDGTYTISFGGQNLGMQDSYSSMPLGEKNDRWEITDSGLGDNTFYVKNTVRGCYIEWYASNNSWSGYNKIASGSEGLFALRFTPAEAAGEEPGPSDPENTYKPKDGDKVVIFYPGESKVMTGTASGTRLVGAGATVSGGKLYTDGNELVLTVSVDSDGSYTFTAEDGKVLNTGATGGNLTLKSLAEAVAYKWTVDAVSGGFKVISTTAVSNNKQQGIEFYQGNFTTYGYTDGNAIFTMQFYSVADVRGAYKYSNEVDNIAQWGGGGDYSGYADHHIPGDLFATNDMLDKAAYFEAVVNGVAINPVPDGQSPYMGGKGIGSGNNDYMQFVLSSAGYGKMTIAFRLRFTNSSPSQFQLQYSTDGADFFNFTTGAYHYSYTNYSSDGSQTPVVMDGSISDGVAACKRASQYIEYTFDVPASAENAEKLYIRLVPSEKAVNGNDVGSTNNMRIDSVVIAGSPIVDDSITGFVAADPNGEEDQAVGTEITLDTETQGAKVYYRFIKKTGEEVKGWTVYSADNKPVLPSLPIVLEVYAESEGKANSITRRYVYEAGTVQAVKVDPNGGGVFLEGDSAEVTLSCATEGATIWFITYEGARPDEPKWAEYKAPIVLEKGFGSKTVEAYATKDGFADSAVVTRTFTERAKAKYDLYFGQLHSHTSYSDGAGSAEEAFKHVVGLSEAWNVDFLAVTDHSNSFDNANSANINDGSVSEEWKEGKGLASKYTSDTFVGIFGYEMTWSNGLGHINTYNSEGFQSRTQSDYSTYSTALQNYYAALKTAGNSLSQFNHPGTTFGDFSDFAHYDEQIDALITLIEVGNGEGQIGSSGYFPSYEYYTRALDKGWHVAPTNNQDNHKGRWGDSNTGRCVVMVDELTEEAIYDAMRNYRVYATEDLNLEIYYTFDGVIMGTILDESSYGAGDKATISVELNDIDDSGLAKVEVIVNGGLSLVSKTATCNETVTFEVPTTYNYYYIKITQADGNIAVTAPVWLGQVEAVGITSLTAGSALTVENQEQTFTMELFNNESKALEISSITFTDKATGKVLHTATDIASVPKLGTATTSFGYTFTTDGIVTITATVKGVLNGVEKVYTQDLEVTVMPGKIVTKIIVDGTHYNDYVTGYYGGNMNNMTTLAANSGVEVTIVKDQITEDMLKNCSLLIISAPARQSGTANAGDYYEKPFEDAFIAMVANYVKNGGSIIITGLADYQDRNASAPGNHAAAQQNKLLAAIGSTMTINDDEAYDMERNGGQAYRLYPAVFNMDSQWTKGLIVDDNLPEGYDAGQTYSQYSGATVNPGKGTALVMGFESTFSVDSDKDNANETHGTVQDGTYNYNIVTPKGEAVFLAYEEVGSGKVFVAGGVFMSDFEVSVELDNIWDLPYANRTIYENILNNICATDEVTPIAETRKADLNKIFMVEGYVTNGTANPNTTFFDAIYVQDSTGGTTCFPYSTEGLEIGTKVRILGYTDAYQDDREIQIISLRVLDDAPYEHAPKKLTTEQAADYEKFGGQLVQTSGKVSRVVMAGDRVSQFDLTDGTGVTATVFIDGYIWNKTGVDSVTEWLKEGQTVSAIGLLYKHPEGDSDVSVPVLRVRNCDEIVKLADATDPGPGSESGPSDTGDTFMLGVWLTVMVLAAAAVVTMLVWRKKTNR